MAPGRWDTGKWRVLIMCLVLSVGCAPSSFENAQTAPDPSIPAVDCDSIIDVSDTLPDDYVELAGAVAMPLPARGMQVGRSEDGYRFSKFGMAIRAGAEAIVGIEPLEGDAYLGFGGWELVANRGNPQALRFEPCASSLGAWVVHVGGIWTTNDGCINIRVQTGQTRDQSLLGIRASCG